ncbi:uncharacterized protein LOC121389899 [Gigantopelta aegis]|uniref:uncharacterized protein LOC121389899 n=1 Tax=Gigantopelta aegis TaxID=1735272 RepID=UPI001B88DDA2|nr:uncharacterized protein LOC121389899 [Gigantopelta aegis]
MNCESTLTINTQRKLIYSCVNNNNSVGYGENIVRNITQSSNLIELETSNAPINVTYCLQIYSKGGGGSLTLQCYSPDGSSMTRSTQSGDKTTSQRSTTQSSSRRESTMSENADTSSPLTEPVKSEISDTTVPVEKTNIHTDSKAFPVAAAVGGAVGAVLIVAVVVVVIIIYIRKKRTKGKQNTGDDGDGDYVISDVNSNNADTNLNPSVANNNVNRYNTDDTTGNTYVHLQHNVVQYVNTPSSVDGDHVYLHVNEPTQSQISDQDYYNTANLTGSNILDSH